MVEWKCDKKKHKNGDLIINYLTIKLYIIKTTLLTFTCDFTKIFNILFRMCIKMCDVAEIKCNNRKLKIN